MTGVRETLVVTRKPLNHPRASPGPRLTTFDLLKRTQNVREVGNHNEKEQGPRVLDLRAGAQRQGTLKPKQELQLTEEAEASPKTLNEALDEDRHLHLG